MFCPLCQGRQVGKIGEDMYYCWDCCLEYHWENGEFHFYEIAQDGRLTAVRKGDALC